jgi:hypothetical protein
MPAMRYLKAAFVAAATLAACGCQQPQSQDEDTTNAANAAEQQTVPQIPLPAPEAPLGREQLLLAAMHAASDFAAGADDRAAQSELAGKKFEFRMRFGCATADGDAEAYGSTFDPDSATLKVRAVPTLSTADAAVKAIAGEAVEAVEGFWVDRPWLLSAVCPRQAVAADSAAQTISVPTKTVGIAQFFTATGPRTLRRSGRPYEATKKIQGGDEPKGGFDLVLAGRLVALPDGRVIACTSNGGGERPACVISVEFGKVWIEWADTKEHLADWGTG